MSFEATERLHPTLALGLLSIEKRAGGRMHPTLGDGDAVKGAVELAVAAAVEAMPRRPAGGGRDRGDAGEPGELGIGCKASGAGGLGDDLGGGEPGAAGQLEQLWGVVADEPSDLALEPGSPAGAPANLHHQLAGDHDAS